MLIFTDNKIRLKRHFEKDKVLFGYHLGDLDDFYFNDCQWAVDYAGTAKIHEAILIYTGCETPTVLAFGVSKLFDELLSQMIPILPMKFYGHFQKQHRDLFLQNYKETSLGTFSKMKLAKFQKISSIDSSNIKQLDMSHLESLKELYQEAYPSNYFTSRMLETGKYYGYFDNDKIVSVSGVHVDSDEFKIAVLGNIATATEYRGKGISTMVTSCLLEDLTADDKTVCLNVKADNDSAIASYTKLGFIKVHEYEEALFVLQ